MCRKFFFWLSAMIARRKKMPITQQPIYTAPVKYLPAVLHRNEAMGWIVEYYVLNPDSGELDRRRIRLNKLRKRFRTQTDFRNAANDIVATINVRLAGGWTPFGESENSRYYLPLTDVLDLYIKEKGHELKDRAPSKLRHEHGRGRRSSQKTDPELRSVKRLHPVEAPDLHQAFLPNSERFGCKGTTFFRLFQIMLYYSSEITAFFRRSDTGERSELAPSKPRQKL